MRVKVLSDINSGEFKVGDVTDFPDDQAEQLIEDGVVTLFDPNEQVEQSADQVTDEQPVETAGEAQEATPPEAPLPQAQPLPATASPPKAGVSPTAEQIAQDVASTESKTEV